MDRHGGQVVPDSPFRGRRGSWPWARKFEGAQFGLWTLCSPEQLGHRLGGGGHAGWAVFVNLLETSAYSPSRHLCQSLSRGHPSHRTPSLIASRTNTPRRWELQSARLSTGE